MLYKLLLLFILTPAQAEINDVDKFVEKFTNKIFNIIKKEKTIAEIRAELVEEISDNIDIEITSKFVLGKYWKNMTIEQQESFKELFKEYLIFNYAPKFQGFNDESFEIIETKMLAPQKYSSKINIILSDKTTFSVVMYLIEKDRKFKIVDIAGEGISFSATQRTEFNALINKNGIDKFLQILAQKIQNLKANSQN